MSTENLHKTLNSSLENSLGAYNLAEKLSFRLHKKLDAFNIVSQIKEKTGLDAITKMAESHNRLKALADSPIKGMLTTPEWANTAKLMAQPNWLKAPKLFPDMVFKNVFQGPLYELASLNSKLGTVNRFVSLSNLDSISNIVRHQSTLSKTLESVKNLSSILSVGESLRSSLSVRAFAQNVTLSSAYRNNTLSGYFEAIEKQKKVLAHTSAFNKLVHKKWAKDYEYGEWDIEDGYGDSSPGEDPTQKFTSLIKGLEPIFNAGEPPFKSTFEMLKDVKLVPSHKIEERECRQYYALNDSTFYLRAYDTYYNKYVLYVLYLLLCLKALKQIN